jgi:molybdate transport system permease protein
MLDLSPFILTFKLALITTVILFVISIPLAYWLVHTQSKFKPFIETLVSLPLVLPPTVLGFYLLIAFSPQNVFGTFLKDYFGVELVFSFTGIVIGSVIYSLPFMVQPLQAGFKSLPSSITEPMTIPVKEKTNSTPK